MNRFGNILYVHRTPGDPAAVARAVSLAENHQARLTLLAATELPRLGRFGDILSPEVFRSRYRRQHLAELESLAAPHRGRVPIELEVRFGRPFIEVVGDVLRNGRDLVIKPADNGGLDAFLFGGNDHHLLRKCPCPVWIMAAGEKTRYECVLAAVDVDPWSEDDTEKALNRHILELASGVAIAESAELHIVHAWSPISESVVRVFGSDLSTDQIEAQQARERRDVQQSLDHLSSKLREWIGDEAHDLLSPRTLVQQGNPREVIPKCARRLQADLLVMGTVSRTGIAGLIIGNTAEMILDNVRCAVLAVKPPGFVSPVTVSG